MPRQLWIPDKLEEYGCTVRLVDGWETRGSTWFNPRGVIGHHTASNPRRVAPSLKLCTDGRRKAPNVTAVRGPLCAVLIDREAVCHVIAAGRANHAGRGGTRGLRGNRSVLGIEAENNGIGEPWSPELYEAFVRCSAALLDGIGRDHTWWFGHKEWTRRKIDPAGIDLDQFRADTAAVLANPATQGDADEMSKDEAKTMQALLNAMGINVGRVDGIPGKRTRAGMATAARLEAEGKLVAPTHVPKSVKLAVDGVYNAASSLKDLVNK